MSKKYVFIGLVALVAMMIVGCNRSSALPPCDVEDLVAPVQDLPGHYFHIGTDPATSPIPTDIMTWEDIGCRPEHYKVIFSAERDFGLARLAKTNGETGWPVTVGEEAPLEPATEYFWYVNAWTDGVNGPNSPTRIFFTGPLCEDASELAPPELLSPESGRSIDGLMAELHYRPGGSSPCVPEGYFIDLQTDPEFGGTSLLTEYGIPGTYVLTDELEDCTTYYWRVAAHHGGERGPFSETGSFSTSVSAICATALAEPDLPDGLAELNFCEPEDLTAPELIFPPNNSYVGTSVTETPLDLDFFQWQPINCLADEYRIQYSKDRYFNSYMTGSAPGNQGTWPSNPQPRLEVATRYYWRVYAMVNGSPGPMSPSQSFFTGPLCEVVADLEPPSVLSPLDNEVLTDSYAELHWVAAEDTCLPDGYLVDLQTEPDFSGTNLLQAYEWPGTYLITDELDDCSSYHWRVAAMEDGSTGPFSEARTFHVDQTGTCALQLGDLPQIEALRDLPCRQGPGMMGMDAVGYLLEGETATIVAQNLAETWWIIQNPDGFGTCYVPKEGTSGGEGAEDIPRWNDPEPEKEEFEPSGLTCTSDLNEADCEKAGGTWTMRVTGGSYYCLCP